MKVDFNNMTSAVIGEHGITPDEIAAAAKIMRSYGLTVCD